MLDIALIWDHCQDGVEIVDYGPPETKLRVGLLEAEIPGTEYTSVHGKWLRPRSDRRLPTRLDGVDLQNPVVMHFINAKGEHGFAKFLGRFGLLSKLPEERVEDCAGLQAVFAGMADVATNPDVGDKPFRINSVIGSITLRPEFDYMGRGQTGRVALYANSLFEFMALEVVTAALKDVRFVRCANCSDAFFVGSAAGRRLDTRTCSVKCRVALNRKKTTTETA